MSRGSGLRVLGVVLAWVGLAVLMLVYAELSFRRDSMFFSLPGVPRDAAKWLLARNYYRNFWGFGYFGFYGSLFLGVWWWIRRGGHWQWMTLVFLLLPMVKEVAQTQVLGRHGTLWGAVYGVLGVEVGLLLGTFVLWLWRRRRGKKKLSRRPA